MAYVGNNPVTLMDPIGEKAFFYHFGVTFVAGMKSSLGVRNSFNLALNVVREDRNSFDKSAAAANIHASTSLGTIGGQDYAKHGIMV